MFENRKEQTWDTSICNRMPQENEHFFCARVLWGRAGNPLHWALPQSQALPQSLSLPVFSMNKGEIGYKLLLRKHFLLKYTDT